MNFVVQGQSRDGNEGEQVKDTGGQGGFAGWVHERITEKVRNESDVII